MVDRDALWALDIDQLGDLYSQVMRRNDPDEIRALILADRYFLLTIVLDVRVAWHPWILDRCREVERDPDEHLDLWSRGHFKSTIITYAGVVQYVLAHPEHAVCIMSYKAGAAEGFASQIKSAFESNSILLNCFPDVLWTERSTHQGDVWSVKGFSIKRKTGRKEPSVATSGLVSGMLTGGHFNLLVYDDTVTPESVTTPEQIRKTTDMWSMSLNLGTVEGTKHWYIGTRYSMFDTYYEMIKRGIRERRHICVDAEGKPVILSQDEFDKKKREMTTRDWNSQMLQTPIGEGELLMNEEWFHTYERIPEIPMNIYIIADTAQKQGEGNDYTVFWVVGWGADRRKYALDLVRDKFTQSQRCAKIFDLVEKWMPQIVFYEENAAPDDKEYITRTMDRRGRFDLRMFRQKSNSGSKRMRIESLEPDFREGLWWFMSRLKYRQYDGSWRDLVEDFLRDEFLTYPQVVHDDMLDALASTNHEDVRPHMEFPTIVRRIPVGAVDRERIERRNRDRAGGLFGR